ncbi:hypothetical protein [Pseudoalteromonas luteoviolacea]|uniref:hypothetical protein n=1 Tax=Pseudoalteromonas luteoviolacea TaxID=43657 RepID=UPI0011521D8C|nr:hypothetical protein [Pseudoalteromonas luteoviolacea]TQF70119.1 hypothetical protein FLM44_03225 [Pseudoalteromonas luteoviolacea]
MGKALVNVPGLNCSTLLSFDKEALIKFNGEATKLYKSLKGTANIRSQCLTFNLTISAMVKGHVKIEISISKFERSSPENNEWQTNVWFYEYSDSLIQLIESIGAIKS